MDPPYLGEPQSQGHPHTEGLGCSGKGAQMQRWGAEKGRSRHCLWELPC